MKPSDIIIGLSMVVIAGCFGLALTIAGGISAAASGAFALALIAVLAALHLLTTSQRERRDTARVMRDLSETVGHCMRQVTALTRRVDDLHADVTGRVDAETRDLHTELNLVADAVRELADAMDSGFADTARPTANVAAPPPAASVPPLQVPDRTQVPPQKPIVDQSVQAPLPDLSSYVPDPAERPFSDPGRIAAQIEPASEPVQPQPQPAAPQPQPAPARQSASADSIAGSGFGPQALFSEAIREGRAEIFLQPIVTLPQRKVQFYETITRIRTLTAGPVDQGAYRPAIADHPSIAELDGLTLSRALQISGRLSRRGREVQIFVPLSPRALADSAFGSEARRLLEQAGENAGSIVFEIGQDELASLGPVEEETMVALSDLGPRFALDSIHDFRFDPQTLARRRFRFARVDATALLGGNAISPDIHPADLSGLMMRFNIRLIATGISSEATVVDLLDYAVPYAQGNLFSPPRPVRSDILAAGVETRPPQRATG